MSLTLAYRGFDYVSYYNGGYVNADSLAALAASGANAAGLNLEYGINVNNSTVYADASYTDSLTALGNTITEARSLGLTVMVKPLIDFLDPSKIGSNSVGDWRAYYNPANPAAFFASYKSMIVAEAQVAQAHGATVLSLGTELDQLTGPQYLSYWTDIISSVRAVFSGKLTYSADWNDDTSPWQGHNGLTAGTGNLATQVSFWNYLDYVGLDVYAPLSDAANPTLANLIAGWTQVPTDPASHAATGNRSLISYFESVAAQTGKPLLFTEIGYESATDAASQPAGSSTNVFDPSLQANLYAAFFDAWKASGDSSLNGVFFWNWDPNTAEVGPGNGANFSPQGLPAAAVVKANFNDAVPPVAHNDAFTVAENATLTGHNVFADNGSGADSGTGFAVTAVDGFAASVGSQITLGSGAHLTLKADGTFTYDPNHAFDSLAAGATGTDTFNYTITGGSTAVASMTVTGVLHQPQTNDFSGNGHSGILWQNADGTPAIWTMDGTNLVSGSNIGFNPGSSWHEIGTGDFNGDGKADILWQNTDGTSAEWFMNGTSLISGGSVAFNPGPAWHAIGTGDFNGDGKADILLQNTDGTAAVWLMNGLNIQSGANVGFNPGPSWHVIGAADFNGDGKADILWQNNDGTVAEWFMNGTQLISGGSVAFNPGPAWHVIGAGDFNGDGKADILWQNADGTPAVWLMNGLNIQSGANVGFNPGPSWHAVGTGDFNGDGKADIIWQNNDGTPAVWLMDGTSVISGGNVGADPGSNWHVVPPHHDVLV